jgi:catechol 2,3-dioxygenase-like lactoylglutathione lyase family enzyme
MAKPPFRADQVGSLLRPAWLAQTRTRWKAGEIDAQALQPFALGQGMFLVHIERAADIRDVGRRLLDNLEKLSSPVAKAGALGPIMSVYCRDPDGNLIEIASYSG